MRKALALAATGAVGLALALSALAGSPLDDQYGAQANAYIAAAPVTYVGSNWGPVPIYEVDLRPLVNETVDVAAPDAATARADTYALGEIENALWVQAGSPPLTTTTTQTTTTTPTTTQTTAAVVAASASSTTTGSLVAAASQAQTTTTAAAPAVTTTTSVAPAASPPEIPSTSLSGTTYMTRLLSVSTTAPLAVSLGKTLGLPVTFASTVKFAIKGKKVTASQIRSALKKSHSVRLTLTIRNHHFVVLSLTA